jgi:hypothetical protein
MPTAPIVPKPLPVAAEKKAAAVRSRILPWGSSSRRGSPSDSPKLRWSNARVAYPASASAAA